MPTPDYEVGTDCFFIYDYGESNQVSILGLNSLTISPYTTDTIEASEFRRTTSTKPGQRKTGIINYAGNFLTGDPGQVQLRAWWKTNSKNQYCRFYFNEDALTGGGDFFAADLANDTSAGFYMGDFTPGDMNPTSVMPVSGTILPFGEMAYFTKHYVDVATPVMAFAGSTITGVPEATGIVAGDTIIVEGATTAANDGYHLVTTVVTTTVTVSAAFNTDEAAIEGTTVHGGVV